MPERAGCRLHLRFQILPGPRLEDDAHELARFCRRHGVEEAVLYVTGEEWNTGFMTEPQCATWLDAIARARGILAGEGLAVSLNLYLTVSHADKGRTFGPEHPFEPMVSASGREAKAVASWACPRWRAYLADQYARFARLGFRVLWLEDDARYRNHQPLDWGGDFGPSMLARFSCEVGGWADRQAVLRAILAPGDPHPWRRAWFDTWNGAMAEALAAIRDAVHEAASAAGHPSTLVGLMSGPIEYHWAEGRDWPRLFEAISIGGRAVHRPGFVHWGGESSQQAETYAWLDMQKAIRTPGVTVEPDVECGEYSRWGHPDALVWWHMVTAQLFGPDALLLNLFPIAGNPLSEVDAAEIGELLDRSRPALDWIAARFPASLETRGVGVPWSLEYAYRVRTPAGWPDRDAARTGAPTGHPLDQLDSRISPAAILLPQLGVAVQMRTSRIANAVFGAHAWALSDAEVQDLLARGLWLDAEAAAILAERGFGADLGVRLAGWQGREQSTYGMERVELAACGLRPGFTMRRIDFPRVAVLEPSAGTEEWTSLVDATGARIGAGLVVSRPARGGPVAVSAFPIDTGSHAALVRSSALATLVGRLVAALHPAGDGPVTVVGGHHLLPIEFDGVPRIVVVQNGSLEPQRPIVRIPGGRRLLEAHLLAPLESPRRTRPRVRRDDGGLVAELLDPVPYLGFCVLTAEGTC